MIICGRGGVDNRLMGQLFYSLTVSRSRGGETGCFLVGHSSGVDVEVIFDV